MVHMDSVDEKTTSKSNFATTTTTSAAHDINNIILYPFAHQVGGHTQLLTLDNSTLCKPLIPRELLFYLNVPKELVKFVPSYKGVVQIRESGSGTYPSVVYQPLRSPKSPYAKFVPGSSSTLPAKFGTKLMRQPKLKETTRVKTQLEDEKQESSSALDQSGCNLEHVNINEHSQDQTSQISYPTHSQQPQLLSTSELHDHYIDVNLAPRYHHDHLNNPIIFHHNHSHDHQIHEATENDYQNHHHHRYNHRQQQFPRSSVDRDTRSSSEENSNASSDHSNGGYFSEDSCQSITDICGSPLELKVQIRQCLDEKILQKNLLRADYISRPNDKYLLLLENVASKYQLPCILDLKMGTRQHGEDASEEKRHRQIAKCQASTSASLGVRLCGMQVYQVDYGGFLWYDKYYGRKMDQEGLKRALHQYFHNGFRLNEDIIDDVIARLKLLCNAVEKSPSFRFYGTSLLIIHEGRASQSVDSITKNNVKCPVDVRLIDFAHTICDYNANGRANSSPSVLKSASAEQLTLSPAASKMSIEEEDLTGDDSCETSDTPVIGQQPVAGQSNQIENSSDSLETFRNLAAKPNAIDSLQGIDFAAVHLDDTDPSNNNNNTTTNDALLIKGKSIVARKTSRVSMGPDKGLLFGLQNLMRLLDDLKVQYHSQEKPQPMEKAMENLYIPVV